MAIPSLFDSLPLLHGPAMKNRFMLAPLTNQQSEPDGSVSPFDIEWASRAASGGYALMQTCATTVEAGGKAFYGQLGVHNDRHLAGLTAMADAIRRGGALSAVQIHHAGHRARPELGGQPSPASSGSVRGVPALTTAGVESIRDSFIAAARRAERAGFDGVAAHGAFGFILSEFLSPELNRRTDRYGGSLENRARLIFEVVEGVRAATQSNFQIGLRLSVERYGLRLEELREVAAEALRRAQIDYLDLALWDTQQRVLEGGYKGKTILSVFADLPRHGVRLGVAGKIMGGERAAEVLDEGADFVLIGRGAILRPDFPEQVRRNPQYQSPALPVTEAYLTDVGLSAPFINYMETAWEGFVCRDLTAA